MICCMGRVCILGLLVVLLINDGNTQASQREGVRELADFKNDDGKSPTGRDSKVDDSSAMRKALALGQGIVRVGPGFYRWSNVAIPSGVMVVGAGPATIIRPAVGGYIFAVKDASDWAIRDITLDGEAQGDWHQRKDLDQGGISIEKCRRYEVSGVTVRKFNGTGIKMTSNMETGGGGGNLFAITCYENHTGISFGIRAEYGTAMALHCTNNVIGCVVNAGNTNISASDFGANIDGMVIEDKENGSHGSITNCLMNHNERYALFCKDVQNGMAISNCCFFGGSIRIEASKGVNITNGMLACSVTIDGPNANRLGGNLVFPTYGAFTLAPSTIVEGNFTQDGPWDKNKH